MNPSPAFTSPQSSADDAAASVPGSASGNGAGARQTPPSAKWVSFLRQYGPIPQSGNQYDEEIQRLARVSKIDPIMLPSPAVEEVLAHLQAQEPRSVIITGTAGDGKTYHCREIWHRLGGSSDEWARLEKVKSIHLGQRELLVIRDLSEFRDEDRDAVFPQMAADILDPHPARVYLVAANDGRLLELLKGAGRNSAVVALRAAVEDLLVTGERTHPEVRVSLINLSHQSAATMFPAVVDAIVHHSGWAGCEGCAFQEATADRPRCPIVENRDRLSGERDGGTLRHRIQHLMELSERNDIHFPVRQLLLLASNAILGHSDADHGLMSCKDVKSIVTSGTQDRASVYRNIFGENLTTRRREKTAIFDTLGRFGIGSETNNRIDGILVYGMDDPELRTQFEQLVLADRAYGGSSTFLAHQRAYLEGNSEQDRVAFLSMLRSQRQRLFFTIPEAESERLPVWDLTVFRYAGEYLEIIRSMREGELGSRRHVLPLVRGLNRIFTGILVTNDEHLILASSGSHTQAKTSRLFEGQVTVGHWSEDVLLEYESGRLLLTVRLALDGPVDPVRLPLTLLRYEFLRRVADGALPSSFSLECYEDFLAFKANIMRAMEALKASRPQGQDAGMVLRFLRVGPDGRAHQSPVEVRLP